MQGTRLTWRVDTPSTLTLLHVEGVGVLLERIQYDAVDGIGRRSNWAHAYTELGVTADTLGVAAPAAGGADDVTPPV
jgi:hypothetical protein